MTRVRLKGWHPDLTGKAKNNEGIKKTTGEHSIKGVFVRGTCPEVSKVSLKQFPRKFFCEIGIFKKLKNIYRIHAGRGSSKHAKPGQGVDFLGCGQVAMLGAVEGAAAGRYGGGAPAAARGCRGQGAGRFLFFDGLGRQRRRVRWCVPTKCHMR